MSGGPPGLTGPFQLERPAVTAAAERYIGQPRPLFTKVPVPYRIVPLPVRTRLLRQMAARRPPHSGFPDWPVERSLDLGQPHPSYAGRQAVLLITHDIDSHPELASIEAVRAMERGLGLVSSFGFVPKISWPAEDTARGLIDEGCDVYVHDIAHNGRLPFLSPSQIRAALTEVFDRSPWAGEVMHTFRTGQLLASPALFSVLAERFAIDMSIPDTERDGPYGGNAGCGTVLPFRFHGLLEIPVTMPQEVFLRQVYGLSADESLGIWRDKLAYIKQVGGVASLNVHPVWLERDAELARVLRTLFAELARDDELLITTPSHLAVMLNVG